MNYQTTWDNKLKLGRKVSMVIDARWITNANKISKLGERIACSRWDQLSGAAQDVLKREIDKHYDIGGPDERI